MNRNETRLPEDAIEAVRRGDKIAAIKITREQTGLSLKDAKEAVEAYQDNPDQTAGADEPQRSAAIPRRAIVALEHGRLVEAVKHLRAATGAGMKDSKERLERHLADNPALEAKYRAAASAAFRRVVATIIGVACVLGLVTIAYLYATGQFH